MVVVMSYDQLAKELVFVRVEFFLKGSWWWIGIKMLFFEFKFCVLMVIEVMLIVFVGIWFVLGGVLKEEFKISFCMFFLKLI